MLPASKGYKYCLKDKKAVNYYQSKSDLELMVGRDEKILLNCKPDKACYVLEGIFNPLLPAAIVWFIIDMFIFAAAAASFVGGKSGSAAFGAISVFLIFHLMPVWIYLAGVLFVFRKYKHTGYIVTDKRVYVSGGLFSYTCKMKPYMEFSRVNIHRGIIDQIPGVGDVVIACTDSTRIYIEDVHDYQKIFTTIKELQADVYSDVLYPNELRPEINRGYRTKYNKDI